MLGEVDERLHGRGLKAGELNTELRAAGDNLEFGIDGFWEKMKRSINDGRIWTE